MAYRIVIALSAPNLHLVLVIHVEFVEELFILSVWKNKISTTNLLKILVRILDGAAWIAYVYIFDKQSFNVNNPIAWLLTLFINYQQLYL